MHIIIETIVVIFLSFYYIFESIIQFIWPTKRKNVRGQTVLITGAGSGLGRLMAHQFARLGCVTVLWDVNTESNEETASQIREIGATSYAYTCDLSSRESIYKAADKVKSDIGDVDILINNAGIVTGKKLLECSDTLIEKTFAVNTVAHFWTVKSFLPAMLKKNQGHIVTIASCAGLFGVPGLADYCSSKFAAVGFDETLRLEMVALKKTGVHTTVVCPYYINTGMFKGVSVRFPSLVPILEPEYVVDQIMNAVLTNQEIIVVPRLMYLTAAIKHILPVKAHTLFCNFFEIHNDMANFQGRAKQN